MRRVATNANCATGEQGVADARELCAQLAERIDCPTEQVLMISTGVIGARLPVDIAAERLARFFGASVELMQVLARAAGHDHLGRCATRRQNRRHGRGS